MEMGKIYVPDNVQDKFWFFFVSFCFCFVVAFTPFLSYVEMKERKSRLPTSFV